MSANVILVIVGIVLILLALGISVWVFVLPMLMPMLLRLKPSPPLRSNVLASIAEKTGWRQISGPKFQALAHPPDKAAISINCRR
jgi:hypothetical protein